MPNKLAIGQGIASGAENFIKSFQAARANKFAQEQQKNQIAIQALLSQLNDESTPLNKHGQIVDEIQRLANGGKPVKDDERLSLHLGLTPDSPLMQQDVDTGQTSQQTIGGGQPDKFVPDEAPPTMTGKLPVTRKRGELTPFDMKQIQNRFNQKDEETRQIHLAKVQADIQEKSYKALGFQRIDDGRDGDGNRYTILQNPAGEVKVINLNTGKQTSTLPKDYTSTRELISQNRASALPASVKVYEEDFLNKINPETGVNYTPTEAHIAAVAKYADYVESQGTARTLGNTRTIQEVTGTVPIQPAQKDANDRADNLQVESILGDYRKANSDWIKSGQNVKTLQDKKDGLYQNWAVAERKYKQALEDASGDETDENVKLAFSEKERLRKEALDAQTAFDKADADNRAAYNDMSRIALDAQKSPYADKLKISQDKSNGAWFIDRLDTGDSNVNDKQPPILMSNYNPKELLLNSEVQKRISIFRDTNKNDKRVKNMSDEQVLQVLVDKGIVSP